MVGYPSHGTHIYQGLDVVVFPPLKNSWKEIQAHWERDGHTISKNNFLKVYAKAHQKALTPKNILSAKKTGIVPLNREVVTTEMFAPSIELSICGELPIRQHIPIRVLADAIMDYATHQELNAIHQAMETGDHEVAESLTNTLPPASAPFPVQLAAHKLQSSSASFVTNLSSPISSQLELPRFKTLTISPRHPN